MLSSLHIDVLNYIKKKYSFLKIKTEYFVPNTNLRIDIFLEDINLGVEVQGEQHFKYIPFFHKNHNGFIDSLERDKTKNLKAFMNGIHIHYINFNEKEI